MPRLQLCLQPKTLTTWLRYCLWLLVASAILLHPVADLATAGAIPRPASSMDGPASPLTVACGVVGHAAIVPSALAEIPPSPVGSYSCPALIARTPLDLDPRPLPPR